MASHPALLAWPAAASDEYGLALWSAPAVEAATGGHASADFEASGVAFDSREVGEGDLFVALKGEQSDGHAYLDQAFARGAAAAIVDRPVEGPHVLVRNTSSALEGLGIAARARADAQIVGVTGSAGKTGVKEALYAALDRASRGKAHRSLKSYNNHVGVPLSLARMPARAKFGVFEMGMNHPGELSALTRLVRPNVAIVTTIAPAHIGFFKDEAAIADTKAEIFEGLVPGGTAILPADSPHFARLRDKAREHAAHVVSFGRSPQAQVRMLDTIRAHNGGTLITADLGDRRICFTVGMAGEHWVANALAVIAAVRAVGADLGAAGLALAEMEGLAGRGQRHAIAARGGDGSGNALLIDESYNANPASMRATIEELGKTPARRRIAVLGAMKELGEAEARYHAELAAPLGAAGIDRAVLVGGEMQALAEALGKSGGGALGKRIDVAHVADAAGALALLEGEGLQGGDAVLVKGSNSVGLGAVVRALTAEGICRLMLYWLADMLGFEGITNLVRYQTVRAGSALLTALLVGLLIGPRFIAMLRVRQGKGQPIREDGPQTHLAKRGTPTMGGLMILTALVCGLLVWMDLSSRYVWACLAVTAGFGLIGFLDDWDKVRKASHKGVSGRVRLLAEFVVAGIAAWLVVTETNLYVPFFSNLYIPLGPFYYLFAAFVIVGAGNAVNLTDGLDGLAIMPVIIACGTFAIFAYFAGRVDFATYLGIPHVPGAGELAIFCTAVMGAGLAFLWFNAPPAAVFMGDTGSLALGGALGVIAVAIHHEIVLAIVGGLFVFEAVSVIIQVFWYKRTGRRVFRMAPVHHHFEQLGWAESTVVIRFWIVSIVLALIGLATLKVR